VDDWSTGCRHAGSGAPRRQQVQRHQKVQRHHYRRPGCHARHVPWRTTRASAAATAAAAAAAPDNSTGMSGGDRYRGG